MWIWLSIISVDTFLQSVWNFYLHCLCWKLRCEIIRCRRYISTKLEGVALHKMRLHNHCSMRTSHLTIRNVFHPTTAQTMLSARHADSCACVRIVVLLLQILFWFTHVISEHLRFYCSIYAAELILTHCFIADGWPHFWDSLSLESVLCVWVLTTTQKYKQSSWLICWPTFWTLIIISGGWTV